MILFIYKMDFIYGFIDEDFIDKIMIMFIYKWAILLRCDGKYSKGMINQIIFTQHLVWTKIQTMLYV